MTKCKEDLYKTIKKDGKLNMLTQITNELGLHARPSALLWREIQKSDYKKSIKIIKGKYKANGRELLEIMELIAPNGTYLEVVLEEDKGAEKLMKKIANLCKDEFSEAYK